MSRCQGAILEGGAAKERPPLWTGPTPARGFRQECEAKGASATEGPLPRSRHQRGRHRREAALEMAKLKGSPWPRGPAKEPPLTEAPTSAKPLLSGSTANGDQRPRAETLSRRPRAPAAVTE